MGALDAFYSTWSEARETFGQSTPQDGALLDNSSKLTQMKTGVEAAAPDARWQGPASEAYAAKNKEHAGVYGKLAELDQKMAAEVTKAANVVTTGRQNLDTVKSWVDSAANSIPPGTSAADRDNKLLSIATQGISKISDVITTSNAAMSAIGGRVATIKGAWHGIGGNLPGGPKEGPIDPNTPGDEKKKDGESKDGKDEGKDEKKGSPDDPAIKEQARKDVDAALKGDKDAQQRVRLTLDSISDAKLAGKEKLDPTQAAYLSQMQAQQKLRSVEQLDEAAKKGAGDIMANSWNLMSNPNIEFPKTESVDGALQSNEMVKGGFDKLPDGVRSTLESPGIQQSENLQKIADIANSGNGEKFATNTDFNRGMMHKVADMMESPEWRADDPGFNLPGSWPWDYKDDARPPHADLERAASAAMNAVHYDHQVVHDAVTGNVEPGNEFREKFKINSDHFMYNLTHEAWDDKGVAAGSLFDWMDNSAEGPESKIAGETARTLSEYLGSNPELNSLNADNTVGLYGTHSLGEVNPNLVRGMAEGLTPYVNNIAGTDGGLPSFGGMLDDPNPVRDGTLPEAKNLFSVLNTDSEAGKIINGAALGQALLHDTAYAQHPDSSERPNTLYDSATLRALVDVGLENNIDTTNKNQAAFEQELYKAKSAAYDFGLEGLTAGAGAAIPGAGGEISSEILSQLGPAAKDSIIGPEPPEAGQPEPIARFAPERAEAEMLNTLNSIGTPIMDLPPEYRGENGRILSFDEMYAKDSTLTPGEYGRAVNVAINHTLGFDFQDTHYKDRYDAVTADKTPDPKKK
ncbi:EspA/EspE family type VII secretion system effector [Mycolicibacterium mageritense]|uniref:TPR repeat region-containing protein n=1 Tax=Mycolicibacterium mageritense TaxID=53462 RepID=UPI001E58DFBE|nr:EspA/EspE family type VII secretion system effector [Mycolicibacterium mageritense]MCC9186807.1 hypothetical protein [Mycolicibacterium mageritense]